MNETESIVERQVRLLIGTMQRKQFERCAELIRDAEKRAAALLGESRRKLRARGRLAVQEERRRRAAALQKAENRIRSAQSLHVQHLYAGLLEDARPLLRTELEARWSADDSRKSWCNKLLFEAADAFGSPAWTIEYPPGWHETDAEWFAATLLELELTAPTFREDQDLRAGLRIRVGDACLDGSIDGLLARAGRIDSRLLAAWEHTRSQGESGQDD